MVLILSNEPFVIAGDLNLRNILELPLICRDVVESGARTRSEIDHLYSKLVMLLVLR